MTTTCARCRDRAREHAIKNFSLDRGIDGYALPLFLADDGKTPTWDDVTGATPFPAWYRLMEDVATGYLANGDIVCECD